MVERYFNEDQEAYMDYLATVPRAERCRCGWYRLGECLNEACRAEFAAPPPTRAATTEEAEV